MKKLLSLCVIAFLATTAINAQTTDEAKKAADAAAASLSKSKADIKDGWTKGGTLNLSVNESGRNDYWVKGGDKFSLGVKGIVDYNFDRKKGKTNWLNSLRARYGVVRSTSTLDKFVKNDDYFNFNSTYGKEFRKNWSYAGFFSLETQFDQFFMTPGYIKLGPGFLYRPNTHFNLLLSPAMANITTKLAPSMKPMAAFGVDAGKTTAFGLGAFAQANLNYDLAKGINYKSVATAFSNYLDHPGNVIFDWSNLFTLTVNKYIGATVSINTRYNDLEIGRLQIQHGIGVGLSYKL
ncbi:MAG: DUF3078 domain-containing protein [Chitinophagaceae bacterium]|nr:DUF3078 domain-containing protein [Chitinophagaceae bacterium]